VDRLWPRGLKRSAARLDAWCRDVAPSDELRLWFGHDPRRWPEFVRRYSAELDEKPETWRPILARTRAATVTLLFSARDAEHNNAVALGSYLEAKLARRPRKTRPAPERRTAQLAGRE
jgi:uncharacterized protein YeaO (DUF488 family)